jgi:hypothetical protein
MRHGFGYYYAQRQRHYRALMLLREQIPFPLA